MRHWVIFDCPDPLYVDEDKQTLTHSVFVSLFPNWLV